MELKKIWDSLGISIKIMYDEDVSDWCFSITDKSNIGNVLNEDGYYFSYLEIPKLNDYKKAKEKALEKISFFISSKIKNINEQCIPLMKYRDNLEMSWYETVMNWEKEI